MVFVYLDRDKGSMQDENTKRVSEKNTRVHREACQFGNWRIGDIIRWLKKQGLKVTPPIAIREKENELLLIYMSSWIKIEVVEKNGVCMIERILHCMPVEVEESFPPERKVKMMCFPLG